MHAWIYSAYTLNTQEDSPIVRYIDKQTYKGHLLLKRDYIWVPKWLIILNISSHLAEMYLNLT